ncbi:MAG TPA: DUF4446 family protein [Chloroflexota bacterium]|nr:DUF4446 family protein [Chloroflexota bacterium]
MVAVSRTLVIGLAAALVLAVFLAVCALVGLFWLRREVERVRRASRALNNGGLHGLEQVLREQELLLRQVHERTADLDRRLMQTEHRLARALQHVHVLRFNPFRDTGGDQSFVLAVLDDAGSGIVLTGLHSRAETRVYAKPIVSGSSQYPLSDEEVGAIRSAFNAVADSAHR